ncbi:MAG: hypothetical protein ACRDVW_04000, partial [Acidimicrobiales bacterium]
GYTFHPQKWSLVLLKDQIYRVRSSNFGLGLRDCSIEVPKGSMSALVGPNGARPQKSPALAKVS